ncbi:MAG: peptide chain release factor-like protein [Leptospira sp.]|nr:peptide chain release factor-like protein [Leptospira sp.]
MPLSFPVSEEKNSLLRKRMESLGIRESDLTETFIRSGGKGGQNVNKVSTAVLLVHKTTGEQVKCSIYRTQGLNRYKARDLLCKIFESKIPASIPNRQILKIQKRKKDKARRVREKYLLDQDFRNEE